MRKSLLEGSIELVGRLLRVLSVKEVKSQHTPSAMVWKGGG